MFTAQNLRTWLLGFSQVFLQINIPFALAIIASIALASPRLLPGALLASLAGPLFARVLRRERADIDAGMYGYNAILLGLLLPFSFQWSIGLALLIVAASLASVILQGLMLRQSTHPRGLPAYTAAFVSLGWLLLALGNALHLPASPSAACFSCMSPKLDAVALGVSEVIFLGEPLAGALLWLGLLLADRRAALWALAGSAGALVIAHFAGLPQASADAGLLGLNGALAGIALGQGIARPWAGACAVALAVLLQPTFALVGLPALTAPFILACWLVVLGKRVLRTSPEKGVRLF